MTVREASAALGLHPNTVRSLVRDGTLACVQVGRRRVLIPRSAVIKLCGGDGKGQAANASD